MKTMLTLASAAMLSLCASAQPVINSFNVSQNFNGDLYYADLPSGFSPGPAGANRVWDFTSIGEGMLLGTQAAIPVAGSPYASQFPQANYCYTMNSVFSEETVYFYHSLTTSSYEIQALGYGETMGIEMGEDFHLNPRTYMVFPYTYNSVFTDTYQRTTDEEPIALTATYDAYGTLIMPFGTFNNVVRQKIVTEGMTDYVWFNVNPFYPILQTALADDALGFVIDHTVLGIDDQDTSKFITYPNPVSDVINIKFAGTSSMADVTIADLSGKKLIAKTCTADVSSIDVSQLSAGIYLVTVESTDGQFIKKIVKS